MTIGALKRNSKTILLNRLFSTMISLKAAAIGTLNIDRKIFKLLQILKWCVCQKEKYMITFLANTPIDEKVWIFSKMIFWKEYKNWSLRCNKKLTSFWAAKVLFKKIKIEQKFGEKVFMRGVWTNLNNKTTKKIEFELKLWLFGKTHLDAPLKKLENTPFWVKCGESQK